MKLLPTLALLTIGAASTTSNVNNHQQVNRARRDLQVAHSITGDETSDQLLDLIVQLAGEENDELEREIMALMGANERNISEEQQRKFRNLKVLVLWLQIANEFGRYCYYGCYCLPEGNYFIILT